MVRQIQKQHQPSYSSQNKKILSRGGELGEWKIEKSKQHSNRFKRFLLAATVGLLLQNGVIANPTGGKVVAGSASIQQKAPGQLDIIQNSHKAVIDWRGFSIARGEHTRFHQPSRSAIALNRVRGGQRSLIDGRLTANGNVWLINPNGLLFGKGAQVNVGGLMATTSGITNEDFMAGRYAFDKPTDNIDAAIVNQGQIEVTDGGSLVLAGSHVNNEGSIKAKLGHVVLASGVTFTMDFHGDGLLQFDIGEPVQAVADDQSEALVFNSGKITVDGGIVEMTAKTRNTMIDRVINMEGVIQAKAVNVDGGIIILSGDELGAVTVSGTLDVSGKEQGQVGGVAKVLGEKVGLLDGAEIDATGDAGGGEVLVGGNFQGKGPEPNAKRTLISDDVTIKADALNTGDGGRVIVWSDEVTEFQGKIHASASLNEGDGGFVEVSGKKSLGFKGTVDVSSANGSDGSVLLDPENIRIVESGGQNNNEIVDGEWLFGEGPANGDSTIDAASVETLSGDIIFQATQDIHIDAALNLQNQEQGERVVFQAGNDVRINADIQSTGTNPDSPGPDLFIEADSNFANGSGNGADSSGTVFIDNILINGFEHNHFIGADFDINSSARINSIFGNNLGPSRDVPVVIGSGILNVSELIVFNISDVESFRIGASPSAGADGRGTVFVSSSGINTGAISNITIDQPLNLTNSQGGSFVAKNIEFKQSIETPELIRAISNENIIFADGVKLNSKTIRLERYDGTIGVGLPTPAAGINFTPDILKRLEAETLILNGTLGVTVNGLNKSDLAPRVTDLRVIGYVPTSAPSTFAPINFVSSPTSLPGISIIVATLGNIEVNAPLSADNIDFSADDLSLNASVSGSGLLKIQHSGATDRRLISNQTPNIIIGNQNSNLQGLTLTSEDLGNISDGFSRILINSLIANPNEGTFLIGDVDFLDPVEFKTGPNVNILLDGRLTADGSISFNGTNNENGATDIILAGSIATPSQSIIINQNAVLGGNLEINTTLGNTQGTSLDFPGALDGGFDLTVDTGSIGDIRFSQDVGVQEALGNVHITRANNVTINGRFVAAATEIEHFGDFTTGSNGFLDVNSLFINPDANSASLSGIVAGTAEKQTATQVQGPIGDPQFTINDCIIGVECENSVDPGPQPDPAPAPRPESESKPEQNPTGKSDMPTEIEPRSNPGTAPNNLQPKTTNSQSSEDQDGSNNNTANTDNETSDKNVQNAESKNSDNEIAESEDESSDEVLQTAKNDESDSTGDSSDDSDSTGESSAEEDESTSEEDSENEGAKASSSRPAPLVPVVVQIQRPSFNPTAYQYSTLGNSELWDDISDAPANTSFAAFRILKQK